MWWELHWCLNVTKDEKLLCGGHHPINWQCRKVGDEWNREMEKEGGNTPVQCYASHLNETFYSLSSKSGLHSPTWNLRSALQKCSAGTGTQELAGAWVAVSYRAELPLLTAVPNLRASWLCFSLPLLHLPPCLWTSFPHVPHFKQVIREAALHMNTAQAPFTHFFPSLLRRWDWIPAAQHYQHDHAPEENPFKNSSWKQTCLRTPS